MDKSFVVNISFFVQITKINQVSLKRTIQDTFNDKILKEFGPVPSMQNPHKVGHYKLTLSQTSPGFYVSAVQVF